jgi:acetyltransferase-like isoleucine patch superfamily enzyme
VNCDAEFGNSVLIAKNVSFLNRDDHRFNVVGKTIWDSPRGDSYKVVVEDDVWIGHGAIILSGLTIGKGSVVAAGSVVNKDIPPYSIAVGVPARIIKQRFSDDEIRLHEKLLNSKVS